LISKKICKADPMPPSRAGKPRTGQKIDGGQRIGIGDVMGGKSCFDYPETPGASFAGLCKDENAVEGRQTDLSLTRRRGNRSTVTGGSRHLRRRAIFEVNTARSETQGRKIPL